MDDKRHMVQMALPRSGGLCRDECPGRGEWGRGTWTTEGRDGVSQTCAMDGPIWTSAPLDQLVLQASAHSVSSETSCYLHEGSNKQLLSFSRPVLGNITCDLWAEVLEFPHHVRSPLNMGEMDLDWHPVSFVHTWHMSSPVLFLNLKDKERLMKWVAVSSE